MRHDGRCDLARWRRLGNPIATPADVEVKHPPQAHAAQDVGEDVLAHGRCAIKFGGFMAGLAAVDLLLMRLAYLPNSISLTPTPLLEGEGLLPSPFGRGWREAPGEGQ